MMVASESSCREDLFSTVAAGRVCILRVRGPLDRSTLPAAREQFESLVRSGRRFLLCDLRDASYADSDALRFLADVQRRLEERGGKLTLIVPDRSVIARALRLLRWERILPWCPSARQAWHSRARSLAA